MQFQRQHRGINPLWSVAEVVVGPAAEATYRTHPVCCASTPPEGIDFGLSGLVY
ncbi:MAG: hypothetical protein AAFP07_16015 [Cyanobacteria bacterium J06606_4]